MTVSGRVNEYGTVTPEGFSHAFPDRSARRVVTKHGDGSGLALVVECESDLAADHWDARKWGRMPRR